MNVLIATTLAILGVVSTADAQRYWVGQAGAWNDPTNWATCESCPGGASVPGTQTDVYFPNGATILLSEAAWCRNFDAAQAPSITVSGPHNLNVSGTASFPLETTLQVGTLQFTGANAALNSKAVLNSSVAVQTNASLTLLDALTTSPGKSVTINGGHLNGNGFPIVCSSFNVPNGHAALSLVGSKIYVEDAIFVHPAVQAEQSEGTVWPADDAEVNAGPLTVNVARESTCGTGPGQTPYTITAVVTSDFNGQAVSCNGASDAVLNVTVDGGVGPFAFQWVGGPAPVFTQEYSGVGAGTYTVIVTDLGQGVVCVDNVQITEPAPVAIFSFFSNPPSCFGECDGSSTPIAIGGVAPYTYAWGNGETEMTAIALCEGATSITVTDLNGCSFNSSVTLEVPEVEANLTTEDVLCAGDASGSAQVNPSGGAGGPYTVTWSTGASGNTVSDLPAGSYTVEIADANDCVNVFPFEIEEGDPIAVDVLDAVDLTCATDPTGEISVAVTGGNPPYAVNWSGPDGFTSDQLSITNLFGGTYTLTITDEDDCEATETVTLNAPPAIDVSGVTTDVSCAGADDGSISLTVTEGLPPYDFDWSGPNGFTSSDENLNDLAAGSYTVEVTDAGGCTNIADFEIEDAELLEVNTTVEAEPLCTGDATGEISVAVNGGTEPYDFAWSGPNGFTSSDQNLLNLEAGSYELTVTDANDCEVTETVTIDEPDAITVNETLEDIGCFGDADGSIVLAVTGGTEPYDFAWSGPNGFTSSDQDLFDLEAGTYELTLTDDNGCEETLSYTINEAEEITFDATVTDALCEGDANGSIDLTVNGGTEPFTFSWTGPNGFTSADQNLADLAAGTYDLLLTDDNGCEETLTLEVEEPALLELSLDATDPLCNGDNDGEITVTINGGTEPYDFAWSGPNGFTSSDQNISGLEPGNYELTVTDANDCEVTETVTIDEPDAITVNETLEDISCFGDADGSIVLAVTGGTEPFDFAWSGPNGFTSSDQDLFDLEAGTYELTLTDDNGCEETVSYTINEAEEITFDATVTDALCEGEANGSIDLTVNGGTEPFTFSWTGPNGFTSADQNLADLAAGTYDLLLTDDNGCEETLTVEVNEPESIVIDIETFGISCNGANDGEITPTVTGGTEPYSFAWSGPNGFTSTDQNLADLEPGTYELTLTDANDCVTPATVILEEPDPLVLVPIITEPSCGGLADASIDLTILGGTPPYTIAWEGPNGFTATDETFIDELTAGVYNVGITDLAGCETDASYEVTEIQAIELSTDATDISCNEANDGAIDLSVTGGQGPFTFAWDGPDGFTSDVQNPSGLAPGSYTVVVTDANDCSETITTEITEPEAIDVTPSLNDPTCFEGADGSIELEITGGTPPYSVAWNTGAAGDELIDLPAGVYSATITDANDCEVVIDNLELQEGDEVVIDGTVTEILCNGDENGAIQIEVSGGTEPYIFNWSGDEGFTSSEQNPSGLSADTYTLTVTDANDCSATATFEINEPEVLDATAEIGEALCADDLVDILLTVTGGTEPYTFNWSADGGFTADTQDLIEVTQGTYDLTITDANDCEFTASYTVNAPDPLIATGDVTPLDCSAEAIGAIELTISGGTEPYTFNWTATNGFNSFDQNIDNLAEGLYTVVVTDANDCSVTTAFNLEQPEVLVVDATPTDPSCAGDSNGSILLTLSGGEAPFSFNWSGPNGFTSTDQDLSGLEAGDYTVEITDSGTCFEVLEITLTEQETIELAADITPIVCGGEATGSITLSVTNGTAPYSYAWNGPNGFASSDQNISGLPAGFYDITVTDANDCQANASFEVTENDPLDADISTTSSTCNDNNGSAQASVSGGTGELTLNWVFEAASLGSDALIENLGAGNYILEVTDEAGCFAEFAFAISDSDAVELDTEFTNPTCAGVADGSIQLIIAGGTGQLTIAWSGPNGFVADTTAIADLEAGLYTVNVIDELGCFASTNVTLEAPEAFEINANITDVLCHGNANGAISIAVNGGNEPYDFDWSGPNDFTASTADISELSGGTYEITITDANGCEASDSYLLEEPAPLNATADVNEPLCAEDFIDITLDVSGGTAPYTFAWSGDFGFTASSQNLNGVSQGLYTVEITDANDCVFIGEFGALAPNPLIVTGDVTPLDCSGDPIGAVALTITGGTEPYFINWTATNGFNSFDQNINDLAEGLYTVVVTDANDCSVTTAFNLEAPEALVVTVDSENPTCAGDDNGFINLDIEGGETPYAIVWVGPNGFTSTDQNISGLPAGTYTAEITDSGTCIEIINVVLEEVEDIELSADIVDVLCAGANSGSIELSITNGLAPFTVEWSGSGFTASGEIIENLFAGTYNVEVSDANGCNASAEFTVNENDELFVEVATEPSTCNEATGTAIASVSGGTGTISFAWSSQGNFLSSEPLIENLPAGNYTLLVTDELGCEATLEVAISDSDAVELDFETVNPTCFGENTGSITLLTEGGTGALTFEWTGPLGFTADTQNLTGLAAGTYTVNVTDELGCFAAASITLTAPEAIEITGEVTDILCNGETNGTIVLNLTGGTAPYSYNWSGPNDFTSSAEALSDLPAGVYNINVTDANDCEASESFTIEEPAELNLDASVTQPLCADDFGSIDLTIDGGTAPFSITWSDEDGATLSTDASIDNLQAGSYTALITDSNDCAIEASYTIEAADAILVSGIVTPLDCSGEPIGAITLEISGGVEPYFINWTATNGFNSFDQNIDNLAAGLYTVVITDANDCSTTTAFNLEQPEALIVETTPVDPTCAGNNNGSINITIDGGVAPFFVTWEGPNGFTSNDQNISGLPAGVYSATITDSGTCEEIIEVTLNEGASLDVQGLVTNIECGGLGSGSIDLEITGGVAPYTATWSGPNGFSAETLFIDNLFAGAYEVTVTDANGCEGEATFSVNENDALMVDVNTEASSCNEATGSATAIATGGTGAYTYTWLFEDNFLSDAESIADLAAGNYTLVVTDEFDCQVTVDFSISDSDAVELETDFTNPSCAGIDDGSITLTTEGGEGELTFEWTGPFGFTADTQNLNNIGPGTYTVNVTDELGCFAATSLTITAPDAFEIIATVNDVLCEGDANGNISIEVSGGTEPYTFQWEYPNGNVVNDQNIADLEPGDYDLLVTDANGCFVAETFSIDSPEAIALEVDFEVPVCAEDFVDLTLIATGGTEPYTFDWSADGGFTSNQQNLENIAQGLYTVVVTDANGCSETAEFNIASPNPLIVTGSVTPLDCTGDPIGAIDLEITGGTEPYFINWTATNGFNSFEQNIEELEEALYTVVVTDANGCTVTTAFNLEAPEGLNVDVEITDISCANQADGSIALTVTGGESPYTYAWTGPAGFSADTAEITDLLPGGYTVEISDSGTCNETFNFTVSEPDELEINADITDVLCGGNATGAITANISGGTPPFNIVWSGNGVSSTEATIDGLSGGTYQIDVVDANGCDASAQFDVLEADPLEAEITTEASVCNDATGTAETNVTGGTGQLSFTYFFDGNNIGNEAFIDGLAAGAYSLLITDEAGCELELGFTINDLDAPELDAEVTSPLCNGDNNGSIDLTATGGTGELSYDWSGPDGYTADTPNIDNLFAGEYTATVTDETGCASALIVNLTQPAALVLALNVTDVLCAGDANGTIQASVMGGTTPYTFNWEGPNDFTADLAELSDLPAGCYVVTVTDANGCEIVETACVEEPAVIEVTAIPTGVVCAGDNAGSIELQLTGGTGAFTITWSGPDGYTSSEQDIFDLIAGTYTANITDEAGCEVTVESNVTETPAVEAEVVQNAPACPGDTDGSIELTISGGIAPYTVEWLNAEGELIGDDLILENLGAGEYTFTITDLFGCEISETIAFVDNETLAVEAAITGPLCAGESNGQILLTITGGVGPYSTLWTGPNGFSSTAQDLIDLAPGTYTLFVGDANGCTFETSFQVEPTPELIVTIETITNESCLLSGDGAIIPDVSGGTPPYTYEWSDFTGPIADTQTLEGISSGSYDLMVTDANGCSISINSIPVGFSGDVDVIAGLDQSFCFGDLLVAEGLTEGEGNFFWTDEEGIAVATGTSLVIEDLEPGTYTFTFNGVDGNCSASDSITVTVFDTPFVNAGQDQVIYPDEQAEIGGSPTAASDNLLVWSPSELLLEDDVPNPITQPLSESTWYFVEVVDENGCSATDSVLVRIVPNIDIPSGFTPNGDGMNDFWVIGNAEFYPTLTLEIYNRWGELLFRNEPGHVRQWDGTFNGSPVPIGTYYYVIEINEPNFQTSVNGPVTILR